MAEQTEEYIFTFGSGHIHQNGFIAIQAKTSNEARTEMFNRFGAKWSMQYDAPDARNKAGVIKYNLKEIR